MATTRLGLSATPRAALTSNVAVVANLAQWQWTAYQATVDIAGETNVVANLAQWQWTQNAATVLREVNVTGNLAQWQWTQLQASVALVGGDVAVVANLAQWQWTTYQANVTATGLSTVIRNGGFLVNVNTFMNR